MSLGLFGDLNTATRCLAFIFLSSFPLSGHSATLETLFSFDGMNGKQPQAGLISDANGNLYGTTSYGGIDAGTVFKFSTSDRTLTTLVFFDRRINGETPFGGLVFDAARNLYGTTIRSGPTDPSDGIVFKISPDGVFTTPVEFLGPNGAAPYAGLTADGKGNLYGTTTGGGAANRGTVFKLTHDDTFSTLASLGAGDGVAPYGGVIVDADGTLYGTTSYGGGPSNAGTVFRVTPDGTLSTLAVFNRVNGALPSSRLTLDSAGNLYGTTEFGGENNLGTIFRLAPNGTLTTLVSFDVTNGANPDTQLVFDAAGNLFGTTIGGGPSRRGTIFKLTPDGVVHNIFIFNGTNGGGPSDLLVDANGDFYGTTSIGGAYLKGSIFKLTGTGFVVPEPGSIACIAAACAVLGARKRRVPLARGIRSCRVHL